MYTQSRKLQNQPERNIITIIIYLRVGDIPLFNIIISISSTPNIYICSRSSSAVFVQHRHMHTQFYMIQTLLHTTFIKLCIINLEICAPLNILSRVDSAAVENLIAKLFYDWWPYFRLLRENENSKCIKNCTKERAVY